MNAHSKIENSTRSERQIPELKPNELTHTCDPVSLGFHTTDDLPDLQTVIGQPRALRALEIGSEVAGPGYNIFVLGLPGSGRTTLSQEYLTRKALQEPIPSDWCYVNNFSDSHAPLALELPAGRAAEFKRDLANAIEYCQREIPRTFESEEYTRERDGLLSDLKNSQQEELEQLDSYVQKYKFAVLRTPVGLMLVPAPSGKPLKPEEVERLDPEQKEKLEKLHAKLMVEVEKSINLIREMGREAFNQLQELNRRTTLYLIEPSFDYLQEKYAEFKAVVDFLASVQADIVQNVRFFLPSESSGDESRPDSELRKFAPDWMSRYQVNVLVDHSTTTGAPVVLESHPTYYNLLGRIEHEVFMGASRTDFTLIQPGALHRANGGYLILPARDVLINAYAWEGLKGALRDGHIRIEELASQLGLLSTKTLDPEPVPLNLKVILIGTPLLYYLLRSYDEDFSKLFKIQAEFGVDMDRLPETEREYGTFVRSVVDSNSLLAFEAGAVARLIEYSSRLANDQFKLSTRFGKIVDLIRESAYWARKEGLSTVSTQAVQKAIDESVYRSNLFDERIQQMISQDTIKISTEGQAVGQVNALSVILMGEYSFGRPSRLTATVFPGEKGIVDIERQAELGGPVHTKGVLILSGYLGSFYGKQAPLALTANLAFEQSYEGVEGDSASAAELFALLSAIAQVPLRQDRAVTGSVNQRGEIQAVGGVNEKIEGFFATCKARGLTGQQGVLIPAANQRHLMLKQEVTDAVGQGQFHIWPITSISEGLEILTGMETGQQEPDGSYPEGSFNQAVADRLEEFARLAREKKEDEEPRRRKGGAAS